MLVIFWDEDTDYGVTWQEGSRSFEVRNMATGEWLDRRGVRATTLPDETDETPRTFDQARLAAARWFSAFNERSVFPWQGVTVEYKSA